MFDYQKADVACVRIQARTTASGQEVSALIHLYNGVTADEFPDEFTGLISSKKQLIAIDYEDIANLLAEKEVAFYGRLFFKRIDGRFCTEDDMSWLLKAGALNACIFISGPVTINETYDIVELIRTSLSKDSNVIFSLDDKTAGDVQVDILTA